jgi:hypothetical protein
VDKLILEGYDNYNNPRQRFADKISTMTDDEFVTECQDRIWLSAYAANNPRSDYHWQTDACYFESKRRDNVALYDRAWRLAAGKSGD